MLQSAQYTTPSHVLFLVLLFTVSNAFQFANIIHWISLIILSLFFSEVGHVYILPSNFLLNI